MYTGIYCYQFSSIV